MSGALGSNRLRVEKGFKWKQEKSFSEFRVQVYGKVARWLEQKLNIGELPQCMKGWHYEK